MNSIQIEQITTSELQEIIALGVRAGIEAVEAYKDSSQKLNYTKQEFANTIGRSVSFVDSQRRRGKLKWHRLGGTVMIPATELVKYTIQAA